MKKLTTKKKSVTNKSAKKLNSHKINLTIPFELHDWSDALSFNQINDTLFIIGQYLNNKEHPMFTEQDIPIVKAWVDKNDITKFLKAKDNALYAQALEFEKEEDAREFMSYPIRKYASH